MSEKKVAYSVEIDTLPGKIIQAFTDPVMLKEWWGVERCLIDLSVAGPYALAWKISERGFGYVSTGIIKKYHPNHYLIIDNFVYFNPDRPILGPMKLTITVKEMSEKSKLTICQEGYGEGPDWDWYYNAVKKAWPVAGKNLKKYLEKIRK
jgi:uncharacterized protein YndB with AHSA1/START domain